jgi:hypothetical protein
VQYAVLLLVAVMGACNYPLSLDVGPYSELTNVKISPSVVRVGGQFVASAGVALHGGCTDASVSVFYDTVSVYRAGTSISQSLMAIQGDTLLEFASNCTAHSPTLFGASPADYKWVTIHVRPIQ